MNALFCRLTLHPIKAGPGANSCRLESGSYDFSALEAVGVPARRTLGGRKLLRSKAIGMD